ncbi:MAG: LptF/LptG family permease [Deltaproteobacteria bacterium]
MTLVDRHLGQRYLAAVGGVLVGVCFLYAIIDFSDRAGSYVGPAWLSWVLRLYANRIPKVAVLVSPAAMLIGGGLTLSSLRRRSELTALMAGGASPARIVLPLALLALALGGAVYEFDDAVAVHAALRAERIGAEHFRMWGDYRIYFGPKRWLRLGDRVLHLGDPGPDGGFTHPTLLETSKDFGLTRRLDADLMLPAGGDRWRFQGVSERVFEHGAERLRRLPELTLELPGGEAIGRLAPGKPEMLSRAELRGQIAVREALGLDAAEDRFEYDSRVAFILVGCAGTLLAAALALRAGRRGHVATSLLEGLVVAGVLWALLGVARALSLSGRYPIWACAFAPEVVGVALGLVALGHASRRAAW